MKALDVPTLPPKAYGQPAVDTPSDRTHRVAIRSWSALTPFGDARATWGALSAGRYINDHAKSDFVAGPERATKLALRVARDATTPATMSRDAAVVVGTSKGPVEDWLAGSLAPTGLADIVARVAKQLKAHGPRLTVSAACASGLHALVRGAMMIRAGEARQVLVVATEASVHPLFLGSFQRLGVLARPGDGCRPFDRNRTGFYMSEAAAAVVLEAVNEKDDAGVVDSIHLDRYAIGADATHLTGGEPQLRTLRYLLTRVIDDRPVDLVHAHGTGTAVNDEAELAAIESTTSAQDAPPIVYSHKGALGHSLGAAGLLSVVINCQAHSCGAVPPNVQTCDPLPTKRVALSSHTVRRDVRRSVAIAAGFGGATAVVSLVS